MGNRSLDEFREGGADDAGDERDGTGGADSGNEGTGDAEHDAERPSDDGADDEDGGGPLSDGEVDGTQGGTETVPDEGGVGGTAPTSVWDPAGGVCATCGATVERRWRDEGGLVCPDCKEW